MPRIYATKNEEQMRLFLSWLRRLEEIGDLHVTKAALLLYNAIAASPSRMAFVPRPAMPQQKVRRARTPVEEAKWRLSQLRRPEMVRHTGSDDEGQIVPDSELVEYIEHCLKKRKEE